jgi:hypothetical protein
MICFSTALSTDIAMVSISTITEVPFAELPASFNPLIIVSIACILRSSLA